MRIFRAGSTKEIRLNLVIGFYTGGLEKIGEQANSDGLVVAIYVVETLPRWKKALLRFKLDVLGGLELDGHFVPRKIKI